MGRTGTSSGQVASRAASRSREGAVCATICAALRVVTARESDGADWGMADASVADKERFAARYRLAGLDVMKVAELAATGSDFGVSGYTTVPQAEQLARRLRLGSDAVVLDLGSGTGWPGLHLAKLIGCSVVVSDPVGEGPQEALARAEREDLAGRAWAVSADGRALPFASATFEAVVHSDVIC
jgi:SAM-dependent methyltransferase